MKFYNSVTKGLKLKVRMFRGLISTFAEVTEEQLAGGGGRGGWGDFSAPPILNKVNKHQVKNNIKEDSACFWPYI